MPTTLTVADFLSLRMQYKAEQAENEIPAVIEHNFKDGRMVDHYFVVPGPAGPVPAAVLDAANTNSLDLVQQRGRRAPGDQGAFSDRGRWHCSDFQHDASS